MLTQHISELEMQNAQCAESIRILEQQKYELENHVSNYQNETKVLRILKIFLNKNQKTNQNVKLKM